VHHDDIGVQLLDAAHRIERAPGLRRYLEPVLFKDESQEVPQERTPIGDDDTWLCDPDSSRWIQLLYTPSSSGNTATE
jgi:hypothetical protein